MRQPTYAFPWRPWEREHSEKHMSFLLPLLVLPATHTGHSRVGGNLLTAWGLIRMKFAYTGMTCKYKTALSLKPNLGNDHLGAILFRVWKYIKGELPVEPI